MEKTLLFLVLLGIIIITMGNGSKIEIPFNDTEIPVQKTCTLPPKNPNSNYIMGDVGCP